ncbi:MAG: class I SAM-dependent methyltransferase, partial [Chloroflexi bacterium]|nr:class I SAM-dependent methyltransferase [Chloroflexota bacterium]
ATVRFYLDSVRGAIPFAHEQFTAMLDIIANGRQPVRRFLDLGAGDGALSAVLLSRYPTAEPVLLDFSPPMLDAARERLTPLTTRPTLIAADLATPAWLDTVTGHAPFDAIVSGFAIHHLEDERKRALYGEVLEMLSPGGTFAHIEHVAPDTPWMARAFDEAMIDAIWQHGRRTDPALTREAAAAAYASRLDRDANRLAPLETQLSWLHGAGYTQVATPFRWYELAVFGGYRPT